MFQVGDWVFWHGVNEKDKFPGRIVQVFEDDYYQVLTLTTCYPCSASRLSPCTESEAKRYLNKKYGRDKRGEYVGNSTVRRLNECYDRWNQADVA